MAAHSAAQAARGLDWTDAWRRVLRWSHGCLRARGAARRL